jgi:Peptidase family M48
MNNELRTITGHCYDGISAAPQPAELSIHGLNVHLKYAETVLHEPIAKVDFGQATQHGVRLISFTNGAQFQAQHPSALNEYLSYHRAGQSWVDRATAKWRYVSACAVGVVAVVAGFYVWGIPAVAKVGAPFVPQAVKDTLGENTLKGMDKFAFKPSIIDITLQNDIKQRWQAALVKAFPKGDYPKHEILFRQMGGFSFINDSSKNKDVKSSNDDSSKSNNINNNSSKNNNINNNDKNNNNTDNHTDTVDGKKIKIYGIPNAMALPNGTIILTDGLVHLLKDKPNAITGVLAHELGHINHHHSMRALIQVSSMALIQSAVLGDHTVWVNQLPLLVGQMAYSRDHESEADDEAIRVMKAANINPAELAVFFERAEQWGADKEKNTSTDSNQAGNKVDDKNNKGNDKDSKQDSKQAPTLPADKSKSWNMPDLLRSHPNSQSRMDKLRAAGQ